MPNDKSTSPKIWIGLFLIVIGGLFLLDNFYVIEIPYFIRDIGIFPLFFLVAGTAVFFTSENKAGGIILFLIGIFFMGSEFWPIILIVLGIYFLANKNRFSVFVSKVGSVKDEEINDEDKINDMSIFGGGERSYHTSNFKGGKVTSIFGGAEINLTNCQLAEGKNTIDMVTIFGGNTFIVPRDWLIVNDALPIFGGFSDKRVKDPNINYDENKKLIIKGIVIFGGGEIKSY